MGECCLHLKTGPREVDCRGMVEVYELYRKCELENLVGKMKPLRSDWVLNSTVLDKIDVTVWSGYQVSCLFGFY